MGKLERTLLIIVGISVGLCVPLPIYSDCIEIKVSPF